MSLRLGAAVVAVLPMLVSGCFLPCAGNDWITGFSWTQAGVFERFPEPGEWNGYRVTWSDPDSPSPSKKAEKLQSGVTMNVLVRGNEVDWGLYYQSRPDLSDGEVRQKVNETFAELGLPPPAVAKGAAPVNWGRQSC